MKAKTSRTSRGLPGFVFTREEVVPKRPQAFRNYK